MTTVVSRSGYRFRRTAALVVALTMVVQPLVTAPASAGWLTRLIGEAGDAAGDAGQTAAVRAGRAATPLTRAATRLGSQPGVIGLAASPTPSGHWQFKAPSGETFTAANASEMGRLRQALAPEAPATAKIAIVLDDQAVFSAGSALDALPATASLHMLAGKRTLPLTRAAWSDAAGQPRLSATFNDHVALRLTSLAGLRETIAVLDRPLRRGDITVVALREMTQRSGGLSPASPVATAGIRGLEIGAADLVATMPRLKARTLVLTGRVNNNRLTYRTATGFDRSLDLSTVRDAAAANDVSLVIVNAPTPRQPGVRNWLWQRASVEGLANALAQPTYGGFLGELAANNSKLAVKLETTSSGRAVLAAGPEWQLPGDPGSSDLIGDLTATVLSETVGRVVASAVELNVPDRERHLELSLRLVPGVPSVLQWGYIISLIAGFIGLPISRQWWRKLWPQEDPGEYASALGYWLARGARGLVFLFVYLPVVGVPAAVAQMALALWTYILIPFRLVGWVASWFKKTAA